jgi:hypothetical protein
MKPSVKNALMRFVRVAVGIIIAGIAVQYSQDPWYIMLAPLITAASKFLRDEYGIDVKIV